MNSELRGYQIGALDSIKQTLRDGVRRLVVQAATGSGKTIIAAAIAEGAVEKGNSVAFVVPAISLIDQTVEAFYKEGLQDVGVIQSDHHLTDWSKPIQVCSIQTIQARGDLPRAKVVMFDECHRLHKAHLQWLHNAAWSSVPFIGLSATPWTKGLGRHFDKLIVAATTEDLIERGYLAPFKVFAAGHPDLSDVKVVAGDYHEGQLSSAMQKGNITADIVDTWKQRWGQDKTLCFAVDCAHAQAIQARFEYAGIKCGYQDAFTPPLERAAIKRKFFNGEFKVVCNVGTLTTGVDWPVKCLILARPTRSEMLYVQIVGRALRTAPDKDHAIILDHSDTTAQLGFVTDIHHETLDMGVKKISEVAAKKPLPKECPKCTCMLPKKMGRCQNCNYEMKPVCGIVEDDGELVEMVPGKSAKAKSRKFSMAEKAQFYAELLSYAARHGYREGWVSNKYREKFGVWPNQLHGTLPAKEVSPGVSSWIKAGQIRWAKSKSNLARVSV